MGTTIKQLLDFLKRNRLRVTYKDLALFLKITPAALGELLALRRPDASWVVNEETGKPSGYAESECHPDLRANDVIADVDDLRRKMSLDKSFSQRPRQPAKAGV